MTWVDALSLVLPLGSLIALAYRGVSILVLSPLCAVLAALLASVPAMAHVTEVFLPSVGGFVGSFLGLFVLGAIFGRLMDVSGAAQTLAEAILRLAGPDRAILAVVSASAVLTYGGVSLFVVAFAVYPLAMALFQAARLPHRLIPAAIALGAFTFTMTALPGTPSIQNAIPMPYFGTTLFAAPLLGMIAGGIMAWGGLRYCAWVAASARPEEIMAAPLQGPQPTGAPPPNVPLWRAACPILSVLLGNLFLSVLVFPALDLAYLEAFGVAPSAVTGTWALLISLTFGIVMAILLAPPRDAPILDVLGKGAEAALLPLMNTASLVGFGAVIAALPGFAVLQNLMTDLPGGAIVQFAVAAMVLAGITGSASGGLSIALEALGPDTIAAAQADGADGATLHRVTVLATGSLDALPHNGAVVTLLNIAGLKHGEAYGPIFAVAVAIPLFALGLVLGLAQVV